MLAAPLILPFSRRYPADSIEQQLPDPAAARSRHAGAIAALDVELVRCIAALPAARSNTAKLLVERTCAAVQLGYVRLGARHGHLGDDFHAYHNEHHVIDLVTRITALAHTARDGELSLRHGCVLLLFAACHDLRQREPALFCAGVGANERASIDEAQRILDASGFCRIADRTIFLGVELAIAGSTFSIPASARHYNAAEQVQSGGALALQLATSLDVHRPSWRNEPDLVEARALALIAADLDTANVAAPFAQFTRSGRELCIEREMLAARPLHGAGGGAAALTFLTDTQEHFFFSLHRFSSPLGQRTFAADKRANAQPLRALCSALRAHIALHGVPDDAARVLALHGEFVRLQAGSSHPPGDGIVYDRTNDETGTA